MDVRRYWWSAVCHCNILIDDEVTLLVLPKSLNCLKGNFAAQRLIIVVFYNVGTKLTSTFNNTK